MGSDLDRYLSKRTRRGLLGLDWHPIAKSAFLPLMDHSFAFVAFEATDFPLTHALSYAPQNAAWIDDHKFADAPVTGDLSIFYVEHH